MSDNHLDDLTLEPTLGSTSSPSRPHGILPSHPSSLTTWSPAATSPRSLDLPERPRLCVDITSLDQNSSTSPPTPLGLPGSFYVWSSSFHTSTSRNVKDRTAGESTNFEGELVLPPPFLDHRDESSNPSSFDGLFGTRSSRRIAKIERERERLLERGRAPPLKFPESWLKGIGKIVSVLGPPDGFEGHEGGSRRNGRETEVRRRVKRAETGLKGYEFGQKMAHRMTDKLKRSSSYQVGMTAKTVRGTESVEATRKAMSSNFVAATPSSLLGHSPDPNSPPPPSTNDDLDDDPPATSPSAPNLQPFIPDSPFLPPLETPFILDSASPEDYFSIARRLSLRRASKTSTTSETISEEVKDSPRLNQNLPGSDNPSKISSSTVDNQLTSLDFVIWLLVGSTTPSSKPGSISTVGGVFGLLIHIVGFLFFVTYNLLILVSSTIPTLHKIYIFTYWAFRNLTGRTEISQAVIAYWKSCRKEWNRVYEEDEGEVELSWWDVGKGLLEIVALHSMTYKRWLSIGPGRLVLLNGDKEDVVAEKESPMPRGNPSIRRSSTRKSSRTISDSRRPSFTMDRSSYRWTSTDDEEEERDGDGLVVTSSGGSVLEGTLINSSPNVRPTPFRRNNSISPLLLPSDSTQPGSTLDFSNSTKSPQLVPVPEEDTSIADLISDLKRYGRLSTASYGLHTYIVSPPTPLLTPSGTTLPHRLFAHLGGVQGGYENILHVALQKNPARSDEAIGEKYSPTFYLLRDDARGEIVVVFRGTQSLADLKTDLEGDSVPLSLPSLFTPASDRPADDEEASPRSTSYRIHAGILAAARHLLDPIHSPLFSKLAFALTEHPGYDLVLTGHSLGSALASTIALLIAQFDPTTHRWTISASSGLPPNRSIRAFTFAHPTTLNAPLAELCALGEPPLVVSVSLKSDVITRAGLPQLRQVRKVLGRLTRLRVEDDRVGILSSWRRWRMLVRRREEGDESPSEEIQALEEFGWEKRIIVEAWKEFDTLTSMDDIDSAVPAGKCYHLDRMMSSTSTPSHRMKVKSATFQADEDEDEAPRHGLYEVVDPRQFYRIPVLDSKLVKAHLPKEYLDAVEGL